jgi:hypothetical protein
MSPERAPFAALDTKPAFKIRASPRSAIDEGVGMQQVREHDSGRYCSVDKLCNPVAKGTN